MAKIEPLGTRVLILPVAQESTSTSSTMLSETVKERPQLGKIAAVGDMEEMSTNLRKGDVVLYPKYAGTKFQMDGIDYLIIEEGEILARIK